jgi:hypothetical protein
MPNAPPGNYAYEVLDAIRPIVEEELERIFDYGENSGHADWALACHKAGVEVIVPSDIERAIGDLEQRAEQAEAHADALADIVYQHLSGHKDDDEATDAFNAYRNWKAERD